MKKEERESLIGKLVLLKDRARFDDDELKILTFELMIQNVIDDKSPIIERHYRANFVEVKKIYRMHIYEIWEYLGGVAKKEKKDVFRYLGQYYSDKISFSYDNFGELVVNTFLNLYSTELMNNLTQ